MTRPTAFLRTKVLVEGLRRAGPNPTRERELKALEEMTSYDAGDFMIGLSPTNRVGSRYVGITVIAKDGRLLH